MAPASLKREQSHWERLAATDPMWVILSEPGKQGRWDPAAFFQSGRDEIAAVLALADRHGCPIPRRGVALDFGCGLGRLSEALAEHFDRVHGVDISARMIESARGHSRSGGRVVYHANVSDRLGMLPDGSIDFVYSRITLQHIPRRAAASYVGEFARVLAPGGTAMFQVVTRAQRWSVRLRHAVRDLLPDLYRWARDLVSRRPRWEINAFPEPDVRAVLRAHGAEVVAVIPDESAGAGFDSAIFLSRKRS